MTDDRCSKLTRAAFLMIKGSTADDITSKEELLEALQFAGFNPTVSCINRHWSASTTRITFSQIL